MLMARSTPAPPAAYHVFQPTKDGAKLVFKLRLPAEDEVSGSPIISHGRIYVPTGAKMYCLGKAGAKPAATPRPAVAEEAPAEPNDPPVTAQIVPVEVLLKPGMEQAFTVKLYNARGRFLRESPAGFHAHRAGRNQPPGLIFWPPTRRGIPRRS